MRIGITGYAESGKDEVADILVEEFGFVKVGMSDPLDKYLQILNPYIADDIYNEISTGLTRYAEFRSYTSYVDAKELPEVRELLQRLGTEVGRDIDNDIWVKERMKTEVNFKHTVTTGIRYVNEAVGFDEIWRVNRLGYGPKNDHSSEQLDDVFALATVSMHNNSTLAIFKDMARNVCRVRTSRFVDGNG